MRKILVTLLLWLAEYHLWREARHFQQFQRHSELGQELIRLADALAGEATISYPD